MLSNIVYHLIFYAFAAVLIFSAAMVILANNPVRMVLYLVLACVASAGLWIQIQAEFLGLILVVVYVGAVMTLFLFVVMMLNVNNKEDGEIGYKSKVKKFVPFAIVILAMIIMMLLFVVGPEKFGLTHYAQPDSASADYSNIQALGQVLYHNYIIPFELAACLLFVAIIAAIYLTHRPPQSRKKQSVSAQISVKKQDRLKIIKDPKDLENTKNGDGA